MAPRYDADMAERSRDWLRQAERDLMTATHARDGGHHEWCCFICQQSAEKSAKSLHLRLGQEAWGCVVAQLLAELPATAAASPELIDRARVLDAYYVAPRYPNGHPSGAPFEHYGKLQSDEAIDHARAIHQFVRLQMA